MFTERLANDCRVICEQHDVEPDVMLAVMEIESAGEPWSFRFEPSYKYLVDPGRHARRHRITKVSEINAQKTSYGLAHVMGGTARWMGFEGLLSQLFDPLTNITYAAKYLQFQLRRYKYDVLDAVAAYNAGVATKVTKSDGTTEYANQRHVNRFLSAYQQIR